MCYPRKARSPSQRLHRHRSAFSGARACSSSRAAWRARLDGALDLLAPARCAGCHVDVSAAPADEPLSRLFCAACERRLGLDAPGRPPRRIGRLPWLVQAPLPYAGDGERWLQRLKYPGGGLTGLDTEARALLRALAERTVRGLAPPDAIVPVPLHASALRRRTFNPALRWADALARAVRAPVHPRALYKQRPTRPQKDLGVAARRENVRDAFRLDRRHGAALEAARRVWLVDDVVTTGATLEACIAAIHSAGLRPVGLAVCIARTPRRPAVARGPST